MAPVLPLLPQPRLTLEERDAAEFLKRQAELYTKPGAVIITNGGAGGRTAAIDLVYGFKTLDYSRTVTDSGYRDDNYSVRQRLRAKHAQRRPVWRYVVIKKFDRIRAFLLWYILAALLAVIVPLVGVAVARAWWALAQWAAW